MKKNGRTPLPPDEALKEFLTPKSAKERAQALARAKEAAKQKPVDLNEFQVVPKKDRRK